MRKKLTAILVALTIAISLLPMPAMAITTDHEDNIRSAVNAAVKAYGDKLARPESDDAAFRDFFIHGFFGNGRNMTITDDSNFVASLFNAEVMQAALTHAVTGAVSIMQELNLSGFYLSGGPGWHNYYYTFSYTGYHGAEKKTANYVGAITSAKKVYNADHYVGPTNEHDNVMELLVGGLICNISIQKVEAKANSAVYRLELYMEDDFNFNGDYSYIQSKGYDTSKDDTLNNFGTLMTFVGLDEFFWEYTTTMEMELPTQCSHSYDNSYHWTLDPEANALNTDGTNGFTPNTATPVAVVNNTTGESTYYYKLEDTIILSHDRPWVMEYTLQPLKSLSLSPFPSPSTAYPYFLQHANTYIWVPYYERFSSKAEVKYRWHYNGLDIQKKFKYSSKNTYSFYVENVVTDSGNMIYATILDDTGTVLYGPEPLNDYWTNTNLNTKRELTESDTTRVSGQDIIIRYIGSTSNRLTHNTMDLRIWENGKDDAPRKGTYAAPTCTQQGGIQHTCPDCGFVIVSSPEPALGHSYSEYADDNNATCTADGTKTRVCARCGDRDTVTVTGSALGHSFGEYLSDGNATCLTNGTKTRTCARCALTDTVGDPDSALGHSFGKFVSNGNATCTDNGTKTRACTRCDAKESATDIGTAKGHSHTPTVTAPTCTDGGYTTYTCHCGDSYIADETSPMGHTEVEDSAIPATCISSGKKAGSHCSVCGVVTKEQELIPIGNHSWDQGTVIKEPTLTEMGTLMYTCIHCDSKNYMSIDKLPTLGFSDVPADAYYATPVAWAKNKGITSGLSETLFGSDMSCTRGQVVTFLWAAAGRPEPTGSDNPFTDVYASDYYYKPVLWAVEQGITGGIGDGLFGPHQECTRGQIVTFLWRAMGSPEPAGENTFTDVAATDWFAQPVLWASENSVTGGIGNGMFGPYRECTRAQVVTFLYKVYN